MRAISICSGYGGLDRALELAIVDARTVCFVERQLYPAAILASRMRTGELAPAPIWDDLTTFDARAWRGLVDIVVAGFPCQGASVAGKRQGVDDERWLWPEVFRITQEVGARWLLAENVPGLLSVNRGEAFAQILGDLGAIGWAAEWDCVPAGAVGAPHLRDRLFLLAADAERVPVWIEPERDQRRGRRAREAERGKAEPRDRSSPRHAAHSDVERLEAASNRSRSDGRHEARADARAIDREGDAPRERAARGRDADGRRGEGPGDPLDRVRSIVDLGRAHWEWGRAPEPVLRGMDDGPSIGVGVDDTYADQLHALGNGVVSHQAAVALLILWSRLHHGAALDVLSTTEGD